MKHFWFGAGILAILFAVCLWLGYSTESTHLPISQNLADAADAALAGNWAEAESLATDAHTRWQRNWAMTASVADHTPMDEIDALFAQLPVFAAEKEAVHFASTCAQLGKLAKAMHEAHSPGWWNLL